MAKHLYEEPLWLLIVSHQGVCRRSSACRRKHPPTRDAAQPGKFAATGRANSRKMNDREWDIITRNLSVDEMPVWVSIVNHDLKRVFSENDAPHQSDLSPNRPSCCGLAQAEFSGVAEFCMLLSSLGVKCLLPHQAAKRRSPYAGSSMQKACSSLVLHNATYLKISGRGEVSKRWNCGFPGQV